MPDLTKKRPAFIGGAYSFGGDKLTPKQQETYDLKQQGMTVPEIAEKLGETVECIKSRWKLAKRFADADPSAQMAANAVGSGLIPTAAWHKREGVSVYYKYPQDQADTVNLIDRVADAFRDIPAYVPVAASVVASDNLSIYALFDAHIGMRAYGKETAGDDYDLKLAEHDIKAAITRITGTDGGEALLVLGGDTLHHDNNDNNTFASKHVLDVDGRIKLVSKTAVDIMAWVIEHLLQNHTKVTVTVHRGNHDPHSHISILLGLHNRYLNASRVIIDMGETDWFWMKWGKCAIFTSHGDKGKPDTFIHKMSDICPFWSESPHRAAITGHVHKFQSQRIGGAMWYSVDAFCPPDEYGSQFAGRRGLVKMVFDKKRGLTGMKFDPVWRGEE